MRRRTQIALFAPLVKIPGVAGRLAAVIRCYDMQRLLAALICLLLALPVLAASTDAPLRFGVLAFRPKAQTLTEWQPLAKYLEDMIGRRVELAAYDFPELDAAVARNEVDAVLTNPGHFIQLRHRNGLSAALATRVVDEAGHEVKSFGGVIFARAGDTRIATLADLAGKRIAISDLRSLGGYQMQAYELSEAGIPLPDKTRLLATGMPHDLAVEAVLAGRADAGFARTGVIEGLAREGKLDPGRLRIVHRQNLPAFPYASSTRLYPEWPVAVMPQVDERLARRLTVALLMLAPDSLAARAAGLRGFTIPADYAGVEAMLRQLRAPPFDVAPKVTLSDLWHQHTYGIVALAVLLLLLIVACIALVAMTRRTLDSRRRLTEFSRNFEAFLDQTSDLVYFKDRDGRHIFCSQSMARITGHARWQELIGKHDLEIFPADTARIYQEEERPILAEGKPLLDRIDPYYDGEGKPGWLLTNKWPLRDDKGQVVGIFGISRDITEQKRNQENLERVLAEQQAILDSELVGIAKFRDRKIIWANPAYHRMFGYVGKEMAGLPTRVVYSSDQAYAEYGDQAYPVMRNGKTYREEIQLVHKDGTPGWYAVNSRLLRLDSDEVIGAFVDITERKQAEAELEQHRRHLEELVQKRTTELLETEARASHILQSSADGLYGVDAEGIITFINPAACKMLGYSAEQVIGRKVHPLFHHSKPDGSPYPAEVCPSLCALRLGHDMRIDDEVYWHADGHAVPVMYAIHPMHRDGEVIGAVTSFVDVSAQRASAQARERALVAAENLARVKSEFLANMSHEIRTPLNGVLGFAEIGLGNYQNSEKARNAFNRILTSGNRLLGVINDILDFSKIEVGKLVIEQTEVSINEVIDHAVELVIDRARAKDLVLLVDRSPDLPETCISDPLRMGQVLLNLLSNAVKFTLAGGISVSVSREDDELMFRVTDTGIGMNEAQLGQLFNPFQQGDSSASRSFGGTGLGLAISKHIVELMGGDIRVESQPDVGTTFEFRLPYVRAEAAAKPAAPAPAGESVTPVGEPLAGVSILVAEDEPINQMVLEEILIEAGASVVLVGNGLEAVERVSRDGRKAYDLVLMDVQMPELDGYEATRRILKMAPDLPVIGQTAHAFPEERERCFAAGMVGHVAKPINPAALVKLVRQQLAARAGAR